MSERGNQLKILYARWKQIKESGKYPPETTLADLVRDGHFTASEAITLGSSLYPQRRNPYYTGM